MNSKLRFDGETSNHLHRGSSEYITTKNSGSNLIECSNLKPVIMLCSNRCESFKSPTPINYFIHFFKFKNAPIESTIHWSDSSCKAQPKD